MLGSLVIGVLIVFAVVFIDAIPVYFFTGNQDQWVPVNVKWKDEYKEMLNEYFPFYRMLPKSSKRIFIKRLSYFIATKRFIPRQIAEITDEMKIFIGASAIQLTFGLPRVYLRHFKNILVYPDNYYSNITRKYHKGEVNPRRQAIVLSWKAYVAGYAENEGVNLGLHEMAHALHLENRIRNGEFAFFPKQELAYWDQLAVYEIEKLRSGGQSIFRSYGGTNSYEFFAVAIEHFFERPQEFKDYSEELYITLGKLLNQDPLYLVNQAA
jgi:Mlc titration factor MtfA (ptsG expression regulator)